MTTCRCTPAMGPFVRSFSVAAAGTMMTVALLIGLGNRLAVAQPNVTGRWTLPTDTGADWGHNQIHLALMRGNGTSPHSYLWSWGWQSGALYGLGLRGWNPGTWDPQNPGLSDGTTYPAASFPVVSNPPDPGVNPYCGGHAFVDGRLLMAGGHEDPGGAGITASRIFDPATLTWSDPGSMAERRWYPTLTLLPSGTQVLTTAGHSFQHTLAYGGTGDPISPTSPTRGEIQRFQLTLAGQWDGHGDQSGASLPDPREGHTAVLLSTSNPPAMMVYGGRTTGGDLLSDVWMMVPQQTDLGEDYAWAQLFPQGPFPPGLRVRHTAIARTADKSMIVFGGRNDLSQTEDKVHRLWKDGPTWRWELLAPSGTAPKRWGHAAVYDADHDRMLVFGGRDENDALAGATVHALSLGASPAWSTPTVTGTAPDARDGHTMVVDPNAYMRSGVPWKRTLVFGGHNGSVRKNDVWNLWIRVGTGELEWQAANVLSCPSVCPPARTRHAALWDDGRGRMAVFGGDVGGSPSDGGVWVLKRVGGFPPAYNEFNWEQLPGSSLGVSGQTMVTSGAGGYLLFARQPELFTLGGSPAWTNGPPFARKHQGYYPHMFVLPSGKVFYGGSTTATQLLNPATGAWGSVFTSPLNGGSAVMYRPGEIMKCGGGFFETGYDSTATITFGPLDQTTGWTLRGEMGERRHDLNLSMLPSGGVIATGGYDLGDGSPAQGPEIWDPASGNWSGFGTLATDPAVRGYHSCALILPDARILSVGGSSPPPGQPGYDPNINRATIFSPPYLYDPGGRFVDDPAAQADYRRPVIAGLPCRVGYGAEFEVRSPQAQDIATGGKACLIRPGAVTHAFNQDQHYVPLTIVNCPGGDRLRITAPANANLAPPGDYLLFLVSSVGVPSIARWVRVGTTVAWDCTDVTTPAQPTDMWVDLISDTEVWVVWTAPGDDGAGGASVQECDLRGSTQPIADNASLCAGIRGSVPPTPGPPLPGPGLFQDGAVRGLTPCTLYRFAAKARDDVDNWGPISSESQATTLCGGGGGGGGFGAQHVIAVAASIVPGRGMAEEGATPGSRPQGGPGTRAADAEPLGGVSVAPGACAAELRLTEGRLTWSIYSVGPEQAGASFGGDSAGILVQEPDSGDWRTLSRRFPAATNTGFALRGFGRAARYVFRGPNSSQQAWSTVASEHPGEVYRVATARHSRLGDQTALMETAGSISLTLESGDTLSILYERDAGTTETARAWFLLIGASGAAAQTTQSRPGDLPTPLAPPSALALEAIQPNPFARSTTVQFTLPRTMQARLEVFDLLGRRVRVLAEGDHPAGRHAVVWDARGGSDPAVPPGVYLCRLTAGELRTQRTMVLLP